MGYYAKAGLGIAIMLAALGLLIWAVVDLVQIGTCASGGPYEIAQECPEGTGTKIGLVFGAVILFLVGIAVFAARGGRAIEPGLPSPATQAGADWGSLGNTRQPAVPVAAPTPAATAGADPGGDVVERLEKLSELRAKGSISETEFQAAKTRILGEL